MRIFLVGMMGAGKTYCGRLLADKMGLDFIDLDEELEKTEKKPIKEIFADIGEEGFRIVESRTLRSFGAADNFIMATGGGTPCFFKGIDWMNRVGLTIFIHTPIKIINERLKNDGISTRPLLKSFDKEELETFLFDLFENRLPFYELADIEYKPHNQENMILDLVSILGSIKNTPHLQKKLESGAAF